MGSAIPYLVLLGGALAAIPAGSFYAWSVFINPLADAHPSWKAASVHANSAVFAAFGVSAAISGRVVRRLGLRVLGFIGAVLSALGLFVCGLGVGIAVEELMYVGGVLNGFGLAACYVASIQCIMQHWSHKKGFASGYFMMVSSSGSFVFAWANYLLLELFKDDNNEKRGPAHAFMAFAAIVFVMQVTGTMLFFDPVPDHNSRVASGIGRPPMSARQIFATPHFWGMLVLWACSLSPIMGTLAIFSSYVQDEFGVSSGMGATYLAIVNIVGAVMRLCVGIVHSKFGTRPLYFAAICTQILVFALMPSVAIQPHRLEAFVPLTVVAKVCYGASFPLIHMLSGDVFGPENGVPVYSLLIFGFVAAALALPNIASQCLPGGSLSFSTFCYACVGASAAAFVLLAGLRKVTLQDQALLNVHE